MTLNWISEVHHPKHIVQQNQYCMTVKSETTKSKVMFNFGNRLIGLDHSVSNLCPESLTASHEPYINVHHTLPDEMRMKMHHLDERQ